MAKPSLSVYTIHLPLSVLCTLFGLSAADFGKFQQIYCSVISVLMFVLSAVLILIKLCDMEMSFASVMFLIYGIAFTVTLVFYHIKFIAAGKILRHVLRSLDNVDNSLESIGFKINI